MTALNVCALLALGVSGRGVRGPATPDAIADALRVPVAAVRADLARLDELGLVDESAEGWRVTLDGGEFALGVASPRCYRCGRRPEQIDEYVQRAADPEEGFADADAVVTQDDGTYNPRTHRFACTECYIAVGMPTAPRGWRAP